MEFNRKKTSGWNLNRKKTRRWNSRKYGRWNLKAERIVDET